MRKFQSAILAIIMIVSFSAFAETANAEVTKENAINALNRTIHTTFQRTTEKSLLTNYGGERRLHDGRRANAELVSRNARRRAVSFGSRTPEKPGVYFYPAGITENNEVVLSISGFMDFIPVAPTRFMVNGLRTTNDVAAQTHPRAEAGSPYKLSGNSLAEFHSALFLPGKLGLYEIEGQVDWNENFYFGIDHTEEIVPLGGIINICAKKGATEADDAVVLLFVFDTFDAIFPQNPQFRINGIPLIPKEPLVVEAMDFLTVVQMVLAKNEYIKVQETTAEEGVWVVVHGDDLMIEWEDYLPFAEDLDICPQEDLGR